MPRLALSPAARRARPRPAAVLPALAAAALVLTSCSGSGDDSGSAGFTAASAAPTPDGSAPAAPDPAEASPGAASAPQSQADPEPEPVVIAGAPGAAVSVGTGLQVPWGIAGAAGAALAGDDTVLISERDTGRILQVPLDGGGEVTGVPVAGADPVDGVVAGGEGGLLGITLDPAGEALYVYITAADDNRIVRYAYDGRSLSAPETILAGIPRAATHNGGRIAFGPDGFLYVATGDIRVPDLAQDLDSLAGKILRVTADGAPAPGNPFGDDSPVWSYGHRNVQGLGWLADGTMVASEFGENTWDEVNVITAGANYGWPLVEGPGGTEQGFVDPLVAWSPEEASPSGLAVAEDAVYVAALRGQRLWRIPVTGQGGAEAEFGPAEALFVGEFGRLRDVVATVVDSEPVLLLLTSNISRGEPREGDDRLIRVGLGGA